jgi:hypothetical protein
MAESDEDLRAWAKRCADITRGRVPEYIAWDLIAERGEEWKVARRPNGKVYRGGPMMTPKMCFWNTARVIAGQTAFDAEGCWYADGFAKTVLGMWSHHAWVVNPFVLERTWKDVGERYVGVTFTEFPRDLGFCQLGDYPLGFAWGPNLMSQPAEAVDRLFNGKASQ